MFVQGLADSPFIEEVWVWSENAVEHPEGDVGERTEKFYVFDRDSLKAPPTRRRRTFPRIARTRQRRSCRRCARSRRSGAPLSRFR